MSQDHTRRPWLAALLSIAPGLGHLYAGYPRRAALFWALDVPFGLLAVLALLYAPVPPANVLLPAAAYLAWRLAVIRSAWFAARENNGPWAHWRTGRLLLACAGFWLIAATISSVVTSSVRLRYAEAFRIPSGSMAPTVLAGDYLLAAPLRARAVRRDQMVVYRRGEMPYLSRVVGLPGDTLAMRRGQLVRNGRPVAEPYARLTVDTLDVTAPEMAWQRAALLPGADTVSYHPSSRTWGPLVIPRERFFVLGDNRDNSLDSRYVGSIPRRDLTRQPRRLYWSYNPELRRVRWDRIGKDVR